MRAFSILSLCDSQYLLVAVELRLCREVHTPAKLKIDVKGMTKFNMFDKFVPPTEQVCAFQLFTIGSSLKDPARRLLLITVFQTRLRQLRTVIWNTRDPKIFEIADIRAGLCRLGMPSRLGELYCCFAVSVTNVLICPKKGSQKVWRRTEVVSEPINLVQVQGTRCIPRKELVTPRELLHQQELYPVLRRSSFEAASPGYRNIRDTGT